MILKNMQVGELYYLEGFGRLFDVMHDNNNINDLVCYVGYFESVKNTRNLLLYLGYENKLLIHNRTSKNMCKILANNKIYFIEPEDLRKWNGADQGI
jgi:hypothetical protein